MKRDFVMSNPKFGLQVKCYGKGAALCAENTVLNESIPTVNIEVAPRQGESVAWGDKIVLQLSERELPELCAVLMGYLPSLHLKRPGKGVEFIRQNQKMYVKASQGSGRLYTLPIGMGDTFRVGALLLNALKKQTRIDDDGILLASLRGSASLFQIKKCNEYGSE